MTPRVSVCLPLHQGAATVGATLASVLASTGVDLEVVVADDGSTDGGPALVAAVAAGDPRVRLLPDRARVGAAANWTRCAQAARGDLVKVLGQDDLLAPDCLSRQAALLQAHPDAALTVCARRVVDAGGRRLLPGRAPVGGPREQVLPAVVRSGTNPLGEPVAVLLRADVVRAVGAFDGRRPYVIDLDYWCRALEHGPAVADPATLCSWRVSGGSWSVALAAGQAAQVADLYRALAARHPDLLPPARVRRGSRRARRLALARRAVYAGLALRSRLSR